MPMLSKLVQLSVVAAFLAATSGLVRDLHLSSAAQAHGNCCESSPADAPSAPVSPVHSSDKCPVCTLLSTSSQAIQLDKLGLVVIAEPPIVEITVFIAVANSVASHLPLQPRAPPAA